MGLLKWLRERRKRPAASVKPVQASMPPSRPGPRSIPGGFVVVDVETTGLDSRRDRVLEIAAVCTDEAGRVIEEWATLINPDGPVGATRVHGITAADVRSAPRFSEIAGELTARLAGRALVAHNARFDLAFIQAEYARAGWRLPAAPYLCTFEASLTYLPDLPRRRLSDCCWACGIAVDEAHSALGDARATAMLLACYLDHNIGRPPEDVHLALPKLASDVVWPPVPRMSVQLTSRVARDTVESPAPPGMLWALLDGLPLSTVVEEGAPAAATAYLEMLFEVLEDGVLTATEAQSLAAVAKIYSLTYQQVEATHRAFLLALAHRIVEDGKVTPDERALLRGAASALGFSDDLPTRVLDEARTVRHENLGGECRRLPRLWVHGQPLRVGQAVAFTGCDPLLRARLEGHAQAAGLRVTGSVSRQTAALITDGVNPFTTKAVAAREHGTRVVTRAVMAELIHYIQPAAEAPAPAAPTQRQANDQAAVAQAITPAPPEGPADIRAWAREHGLAVGVRGRIPAHVLAAYRTARTAPTDART